MKRNKETKYYSEFLKEKQEELQKICLEEWEKVTCDTKFSKEYGNEKK